MEDLRVEVRQIGHHKYEYRFDDAHFVRESRYETGGEAPHHPDDGAADRDDEEVRETGQQVSVNDVVEAHFRVGLEQMVEDDGDGIVEQGLAEHDDVQDLVHLDLLEDGQHGHRIDGRDQRSEQEHVQEGRVVREQTRSSHCP